MQRLRKVDQWYTTEDSDGKHTAHVCVCVCVIPTYLGSVAVHPQSWNWTWELSLSTLQESCKVSSRTLQLSKSCPTPAGSPGSCVSMCVWVHVCMCMCVCVHVCVCVCILCEDVYELAYKSIVYLQRCTIHDITTTIILGKWVCVQYIIEGII